MKRWSEMLNELFSVFFRRFFVLFLKYDLYRFGAWINEIYSAILPCVTTKYVFLVFWQIFYCLSSKNSLFFFSESYYEQYNSPCSNYVKASCDINLFLTVLWWNWMKNKKQHKYIESDSLIVYSQFKLKYCYFRWISHSGTGILNFHRI